MMSQGIHHVTLITRKVQANVDFYAGFLGLRLVKRTAGYEDASQLHVFYGDAEGSPGTLVTFLAWEDGSPGRVGVGQVGEIALAIEPASIGFWLTRALTAGVPHEGPSLEFGEPVLRLKDPDGIIVKLVGVQNLRAPAPWRADGIPPEHTIGRIRGVTIFAEDVELTHAFLERHFCFGETARHGAITRLASTSGDVLDLRDAAGFWSSAPGTGTVDHVALRARDRAEVETADRRLREANASTTSMHDRRYFYSLYVREPGGVLLELATDGPGMTVDELPSDLGARLFFPQAWPEAQADIEVRLPQFGMPGEPRTVYRELPFVHRIVEPAVPDGSTLVLLHGSGGNETSLLPFARRVAPNSTLLAVRGRSFEEGAPRWFRRHGGGFDQDDIGTESEAFAAFLDSAAQAYGFDPANAIFLGQSNGANFLAAFMLLYPGGLHRAALLRPVPVLDPAPEPRFDSTAMLIVTGTDDPQRDGGTKLGAAFTRLGADVDVITVPGGHDIGDADIAAFQAWRSKAGL